LRTELHNTKAVQPVVKEQALESDCLDLYLGSDIT
jgi:hypothetical protein